MTRKIVSAVCWFLILAVILILAVLLGAIIAVVVVPLVILAIAAHRVIRSTQKREALARKAKASSGVAAMGGIIRGYEARTPIKKIRCEHEIRGKGDLEIYKDGTLQFTASGEKLPRFYALIGMDPVKASVWSLIGRIFMISSSTFRNRLIKAGRDLPITWHSIRYATASQYCRIILAYVPPGEGLRYEEFTLLKEQEGTGGGADAAALIRDLELPEPPPDARREMLRWSREFHRKLVLTLFCLKNIGLAIFYGLLIALTAIVHFVSARDIFISMELILALWCVKELFLCWDLYDQLKSNARPA